MASFKALNLESDDESDIEVDNTKEIQIEDALKLYQSALKFHAEGPGSFEQAAEAYRLLFESDIFKYPESQAELRYIELYGIPPENDETLDDVVSGSVIPSANLESGPSTLPQILHLAHKNYAQFKLEALIAKFDQFQVSLNQILVDATEALDHFVHALDKDDTDQDLWRRTACVGEMLDSKRVARYCLESVLDGDDDGFNGILSLPGLEESLAGDLLRNLVRDLQDSLSMFQGPLTTSRRSRLSKILKQRLHPYEGLIEREKLLRHEHEKSQQPTAPEPVVLKAPKTWSDLGEALILQFNTEQHSTTSFRSGSAITFDTQPQSIGTSFVVERISNDTSPTSPLPAQESMALVPVAIRDQFPGLDKGLPTAQPQIAAASDNGQMSVVDSPEKDLSLLETSEITLPSRKRSGESAGINDGQEEGRTKSRRIRARDSNVESADSRQAIIDANTRWEYEQQLNEVQAADDWMFETVGSLFEKVGVVGFDAARHVRQDLQGGVTSASNNHPDDPSNSFKSLRHARSDLQSFLDKYNDQMAHLILHGDENFDLTSAPTNTGSHAMFASGGSSKNATKLPTIPNDGLSDLLQSIGFGWFLTKDVNWAFLEALLSPGRLASDGSSYTEYAWPETLKTMVVRNLVTFDNSLYEKASSCIEDWCRSAAAKISDRDDELVEMIQTMFELHLDIYCLIKQKNSGVDENTVVVQRDRLQRWSDLTGQIMRSRAARQQEDDVADRLTLRFLWATTFHIGASEDVSQEHIIECMNDLRRVFVSANEPTIQLQNNAIMPELSVEALDQEMSKLTTREFFSKVTDYEQSDPAALIENLEPLLEQLDLDENETASSSDSSLELIRFLKNSDLSVKLMLWQRLRDAYHSIEYQPMVVYCQLRMIRIVLEEIKSSSFAGQSQAERQVSSLKSLRLVRVLVKKTYDIFQEAKDAAECIDEDGLRTAVAHFGEILQMTQVFNVAEDSIRVGQSQAPSLSNGLPVASYTGVNKAMSELQIQIWTILYTLLKEAMSQNAEQFVTPLEDRFDFLRTVHRNFGLRKICGGCNRAFVRMLKAEFFQMTHVEGYDSEQAQVLYDLHGLNCFLNPSYELMEHDCVRDAFIDRNMALQSVDLLLAQASKLPIKELIKHPLKDTIDKVHGALARKKPTEAILRNREVYRAFLRSPINPLDIFNCLSGEGNQLLVSPIPREDALLASKGWYFLMGHMALTRFRSQKRTAPTPTEDVEIAIAFFNQDLEYTVEHWETWYRLAQAFDTKIEENVVWSAEKLNNNMTDIVTWQRSAIHCYTMATALAHRSADLAFETSGKMTELYADFACRLYSTSREPFSMLPFAVDDSDRYISTSHGIDKEKSFQPLSVYTAWKLALSFFGKALSGKSDQWMLHYMMGKCLAKMHHADEQTRRQNNRPSGERVIGAFVRALELLPEKDKKEGRDSKREPVLEPHYKLVSVVHKLVTAKSINLEQAKAALEHTHYATRDEFPKNMDEWVPYILAVIKHLRTADKSNWYHRMIARTAQIVYQDLGDTDEDLAARAAKHELTQQMFTKTMVLQVWKPETERAGRHFVYTARYTRFFVKILKQLRDRTNLEALARRVRRRTNDLFEHGLVWQETCAAYMHLLRTYGQLSEGLETSTFSNIAHDDFLIRKEPLEKWMQSQPQGASPALDVLRDVQELKKVNQGLMKTGMIDDLIGDSYAHLFNTVGKQLFEDERKAKQEEEAKRPPPAVASPKRNPMMSLTNLINSDSNGDTVLSPRALIPLIPIVTTTPDQAPARRKIGVGRREIRTCAESCFLKGGAGGANNGPSAKNTGPSNSRVQTLVEDNQQHQPGDASVDTSAPASIHDSADESELSELEEVAEDSENEDPMDRIHRFFPTAGGGRGSSPRRNESEEMSEGGFETADEEAEGGVGGNGNTR